jgi:hypothetical protein
VFCTDAKYGPKGRQTGYIVKHPDGDVVATFTNKEFGSWRYAKNAAEKRCREFNDAAARYLSETLETA